MPTEYKPITKRFLGTLVLFIELCVGVIFLALFATILLGDLP